MGMLWEKTDACKRISMEEEQSEDKKIDWRWRWTDGADEAVQRRSKDHLHPETLRPHHWHATTFATTHQSPLAPSVRANYIQGDDADIPCTAMHGSAQSYLATSFTCVAARRTDAGSSPPPLNRLTFQPAVGQQSEVVLFLLLVQRCGTACQAMWHQLRRWRCSRTDSRRTCSAADTKLFDSEWHFSFLVITFRAVSWSLQ